jgi:hypothetical protein
MDLLGKARKLESSIARSIDRAAQRLLKSGGREPLEIMHAIVDAIEEEVQPAGRGARLFPFNRIKVSVVAAARDARARYEAVFNGKPSLRERILDRLESAGCEVSDLVVKVAYVVHAGPDWQTADCHVEFSRVAATDIAVQQPRPVPCRIALTIVAGAAEQRKYAFTLARIDLGRCSEVRDRSNRLIRTNHVAFADSDAPPNQSVSRCHAHIQYAADVRQYRVYDDRSRQGTGILRNGKTIVVPPGSHGVRLQSGDEIVLGEARVLFTHHQADGEAGEGSR